MMLKNSQTVKAAARVTSTTGRKTVVVCSAQQQQQSRRQMLLSGAAVSAATFLLRPVEVSATPAAPPSQENIKILCDAECAQALESSELVTTPSGLQYKDMVVGKGPSPPTGYQVVAHVVAMTPNGRIFDSSLDRGAPVDMRVGGGQVIPGLEEGLKSMRVGGMRRLYIPGNLAFPKGLRAAAGRPSIPPASPVVFDVQLLYIPGLEADEE